MNCDDFEARMHQCLDERCSPSDDRLLLDHASECPGCADILETYGNVFRQLGECQPPPLDDDFSRRTVQLAMRDADQLVSRHLSKEAQHRTGRPLRSISRPRIAYRMFGLLACVVLMAVLVPLWLSSVGTDGPVTPSPVGIHDGLASVDQQTELLPRALSDLLAVSSPVPPPHDFSAGGWRVVWTQWSTAIQSEPLEPLDTWTQGIKPITASLHTAWLSLRTSFPLYEQGPQFVGDEVPTSS